MNMDSLNGDIEFSPEASTSSGSKFEDSLILKLFHKVKVREIMKLCKD